LLLLAAGCDGADQRAAELDCQRRLVAAIDLLPSGAGRNLAMPFAAARDRLTALPTEGCSEAQRNTAESLARLGGRLAAAAERIGEARPGLQPEPSPRTSQAIAEFSALIEQFENRRLGQKRELDRMQAQAEGK
jgi:hypothetical protein